MQLLLVGGTGFIGSSLIPALLSTGHTLSVLVRSSHKASRLPEGVTVVTGDPSTPGPWQNAATEADAVINLTGHNIFTRWTTEAKTVIRESRICATRNIVQAMRPGQTLINASAVGYYGFDRDHKKNEAAPPGNDFLSLLCVEWEGMACKAKEKKARVITPRIGIVLGKKGGALAKMLPAFRLGVAGRLGNGHQWFPWIHLDDLVAIFLFCLDHPELSGPINCCAPNPVRNNEFTKTLGRVLHRPTILPVPAWVIRLALGEVGNVVLEGARVVPEVLTRHGFSFRYPELEPALLDLVGKN